jgi:membrane protein DedA with SNARE-associated domain
VSQQLDPQHSPPDADPQQSPPDADPTLELDVDPTTLELGVDATLVEAAELHPDDRVPGLLRRTQSTWLSALSTTGRNRLALLMALVGVAAATIFLSAQLLRLLLDITDLGSYTGLFIVNWVANGGLLVPIPGLRIVGWVLIISQGSALDPAVAGVVGGIAMALGQTSYYVAADASRHRSTEHSPRAPGPPRHPRLARLSSSPRMLRARERITHLIGVHGFATIAVLSLIPSPLTAFACGTAGAMGMGFRRFVLASLLGRIALGLVLAYLGDSLEQLFGSGGRL